jgi:hypothetical protein
VEGALVLCTAAVDARNFVIKRNASALRMQNDVSREIFQACLHDAGTDKFITDAASDVSTSCCSGGQCAAARITSHSKLEKTLPIETAR